MCQIPHPSITIQCQIPTLYIHTRICAGTRANACAVQKPHPWDVISWRIPYQAPPLSPTGGVGRNIDRRIILKDCQIQQARKGHDMEVLLKNPTQILQSPKVLSVSNLEFETNTPTTISLQELEQRNIYERITDS